MPAVDPLPDAPLPLAGLPTPVHPADRLGAALGLEEGRLWVKRDDLTALAGGGNKARKLEWLVADAVARGCEVLVTGGGTQSNHCRMTAAAAARLGLRCRLVLAGDEPDRATGNVVLDLLFGAEIVWAGALDYHDLEAAIVADADDVGSGAYPIPIGGASVPGAAAYAEAAVELTGQLDGVALIVVADGSGGTHAGLAAGLGDHRLVLGVDVGARMDLPGAVAALADEVATATGRPPPAGEAVLDRHRVGDGYAAPTAAAREALDLFARHEGLILDPVYTGKAGAGLVAAARSGRLPGEGAIVFWHTGGLPALFAPRYADWIGSPAQHR